jgi:hypothetical protein
MGVHDPHNAPGSSPAQILHDGCLECSERSQRADRGIGSLDRTSFLAAWARAAQLELHGLDDPCRTEMPLLHALWAIQLKLQEFGWPLGRVIDISQLGAGESL